MMGDYKSPLDIRIKDYIFREKLGVKYGGLNIPPKAEFYIYKVINLKIVSVVIFLYRIPVKYDNEKIEWHFGTRIHNG